MTVARYKKSVAVLLVAVAVLAIGSLLAANVFPDEMYAAIRYFRNWPEHRTASSSDFVLLKNSGSMQRKLNSQKSLAEGYVLLPSSEARKISTLCSRVGPKVEGTWNLSKADVAKLETHLSRISELTVEHGLRGLRIAHPEACHRQYLGVIVGGRRLIYVNAFCGIDVSGWRSNFVVICDGGVSVWGVLYDPASGAFFELSTNGIA